MVSAHEGWRDHLALGTSPEWDLIDFEQASLVTGSKFCFLKRDAALLELALQTWAINKLVGKYDFELLATPDIVLNNVAQSCGFQV